MSRTSASGRRVTLLDLQSQNILSVAHALEVVGAEVVIARDAASLQTAELLLLPGVGSFAEASRRLFDTGMAQAIQHHVKVLKRPVVGFCLGMQLLADSSEEHGLNPGLGLIPGQVVKLREHPPEDRVPNVGWRTVHLGPGAPSCLPPALNGADFYHVHSYHFQVANPSDCVGSSRFANEDVASIVQRGQVFGTQFHPEKSQEPGLDLLHALVSHWR
jgi:glutamine amidotransferase